METIIIIVEQALNGDRHAIIKIVAFFLIVMVVSKILGAAFKHPAVKRIFFILFVVGLFLMWASPYSLGEQFNIFTAWIDYKIFGGN